MRWGFGLCLLENRWMYICCRISHSILHFIHIISIVTDSRHWRTKRHIWTVARKCAKIDEVRDDFDQVLPNAKTDGCTTVLDYYSSGTTINYPTICYCHTDFCNGSRNISSPKTWTWICALILFSVISKHVL